MDFSAVQKLKILESIRHGLNTVLHNDMGMNFWGQHCNVMVYIKNVSPRSYVFRGHGFGKGHNHGVVLLVSG